MKIGFTIGKFAPLHKGHEYLINKGIEECDKFYILINETDVTNIPVEVRANWIKRLYPHANVIIGKNSPKQFGMDEESINIQTNYLKEIFKDIPVNVFYSSEPYGYYVAKAFNIEERRIDKQFGISANMFRKEPEKYKNYVNNDIYKEYIKFLGENNET